MINIKELERRWLKYKTKSFLLVGSIASIFGGLIYGGYYILFKLNFDQKSHIKVVTPKDINSSTTKTKDSIEREEELFLTPIIPIVEERDDKKIRADRGIKIKRVRHTTEGLTHRPPKPKPTHLKVSSSHKSKQKLEIKISSKNYMQIMKQKFAKNKNPRDAILIAKAYFNIGNYEKSKEWALRANSLDRYLEESWIIFAKSKQMLGQRDEALNILITYYKRSRSKRVKELIEKIKTESI